MNVRAWPGRRRLQSSDMAFIVVVVAATISTFGTATPALTLLEAILLLVGMAAFTVIGVVGSAMFERPGPAPPVAAYFVVQLPLAAALVLLSRGGAWLVLLPIAGHAVVLLSRRGVLAVCAVTVLTFIAPMIGQIDPAGAARALIGYLAALVFVVVFTQITVSEQKARAQVERLAAELDDANRKLRDHALQAEELATTKERNRLAREIHDSLGHYLTVVNVQLEAARALMDRDRAQALTAVTKAQTLTQEALADVRRSVATLRAAPTAGRPLPDAIAALVDESAAAGIHTELAVTGQPRPLAPPVELALYRAAQEGLTNIRKHARASRADLTLDYGDDDRVRLTVRDDGVGSDATGGGFGLLGLSERLQAVGGQVSTRTAAGQGFTLAVEVPG